VTKKRKIILISLAVTLALAVGVGGLVYAENNNHYHEETGGNKLLGVGEMGTESDSYEVFWQSRSWDTQFIITNPNCEQDLTIEWVALIAGEDNSCGWFAEDVIFEGTPDDWANYTYGDILIPGNDDDADGVLSPHEVWQVSIAELCAYVVEGDPEDWIAECNLGKYTLEVTWSGARYTGWWWWGYWRSGRPLTGWAKEKCWYVFMGEIPDGFEIGMAISEAEMKVFPSRRPFSLPDWWEPPPI